MSPMSSMITPTAAQLDQVKRAIAAHIQSIDQHRDRRDGAYPYSLFHAPDQPIHGTVMMFHGFSAKPHQLWRLADYLFQNGFNVYQCTLAGHALMNPAVHWPQIDLKPEYAEPLKHKVSQDPVLSQFIQGYQANPAQAAQPSPLQQAALLARLLAIEPELPKMQAAIQIPNHPDFDTYFTSSHQRFGTEAIARLQDLEAMPGPIFTLGLSVGGAVALGVAAAAPDRVQKVVAYAPLLEIYGFQRRQYVELTGPLDLAEMGWDPALQFPVGCLTAADRFGGNEVRTAVSVLRSIPTFLVLTENEDAADIETNQQFFADLGGTARGHRSYLYPAAAMVPHPMVDPTEVSQNMRNAYWQSLYQETYRFLIRGEVNADNLGSLTPTADLPAVPNLM